MDYSLGCADLSCPRTARRLLAVVDRISYHMCYSPSKQNFDLIASVVFGSANLHNTGTRGSSGAFLPSPPRPQMRSLPETKGKYGVTLSIIEF